MVRERRMQSSGRTEGAARSGKACHVVSELVCKARLPSTRPTTCIQPVLRKVAASIHLPPASATSSRAAAINHTPAATPQQGCITTNVPQQGCSITANVLKPRTCGGSVTDSRLARIRRLSRLMGLLVSCGAQ